jgi:hypothetical protein
VTRESQPVTDAAADEALTLGQAAVWGFGRTVAVEHPEIWGGLIDVDGSDRSALARALVAEISAAGTEDQVVLRQGRRYVARLARLRRASSDRSIGLHGDATYLVAGGTGGMGTKVARWLIERGARHVVLTGRTGAKRLSAEERQAFERSDADVVVMEADSASASDVVRVLAEIDHSMPPLRGIIDVAGIFDDRVLLRQDWERFQRVLAPKVRGGFILHQLTRERPLDFFVLFSSAASFLAPVGLGNYAAGNAFLDALAHHRRRLGLPALSIDWGPWEKVGMAEAVGERRESQWTQAGFSTMTPEQGLEVMERLIVDAPPQVAVLLVDWPKYVERFDRCPVLYGNLVRERRHGRTASAVASTSTLLQGLDEAQPADRLERVIDHVVAQVAEVLGFPRGYVLDREQNLFDLGMDSLTAIELKNRLQAAVGRPLSSKVVFEHPSAGALAGWLTSLLDVPPASGVITVVTKHPPSDDGIAPEDAAELLSRLPDLSDTEVETLLARMTPPSGTPH